MPSSSRARRVKIGAALAMMATLAFLGSAWLAPLPTRLHTAPSPTLLWRDGTTAHIALAPDDRWRMRSELERLDEDYTHALISLEDSRFWYHPGVDPVAIVRAAVTNVLRGRVVSGASTITMQVVRVLEPRPRTLQAKIVEAWRAVGLELKLSKREILEAYITFVPYGRNVEGVASASWAYFGHDADELSPDEIALLLAVPQAPSARYPCPKNRVRLARARDNIARYLAHHDALPLGESLPSDVLSMVEEAPVPERIRSFPREVPHVQAWLGAQDIAPGTIPTTLDRGVQRITERVLARFEPTRRRQGIHDTAVLVADLKTGEIRAAIGGFDFWHAHKGAQIPSFDVPRSPGSALKPWIYAMAIDRGLAIPEQLVTDLPRGFGSYRPTNYDGSFSGLVRLEDALSRSLNLPFVELLAEIGVEHFIGSLSQGGVTSLQQTPGHYGLSAAVGGIELTALELLQLYTALANDGELRPLTMVPRAADVDGLDLLSPEASWLTRRALRLRDRPDFPSRKDISKLPRQIAWKTGTSFGHHDAWAVGFDQDTAALVWMGNLDQSASRALVGAEASGEVLFDILEALRPSSEGEPDEPPPGLTTVSLCSLSGHIPSGACPETRESLGPVKTLPSSPCPFHVRLEVDRSTGLAVGPGCRGDRPTDHRVFVKWPSEVRRWLKDQQFRSPAVPAWAPGCRQTLAHKPPRIIHPGPHHITRLLPTRPTSEQEIPLEASTDHLNGELSWFIDGTFLGTWPGHQRIWWAPTVGPHELVVVDQAGQSASRHFQVQPMHAPTRQ